MTMAEQIRAKLEAAFAPDAIEVVDESHKHRGHAGWRPEGETHFHLRMTAPGFAGQGRVARQRLVNAALREELATTVHALSMELRAPGE
ncbi:MAG: BolA family protein [Pseudomonadota bacterium]